MPTTYIHEFIPSTNESTHLSKLSVIRRWINPRHSFSYPKSSENEWARWMSTLFAREESVQQSGWLVSQHDVHPCSLSAYHALSLALSPLSLSWYRTVYNLARSQCACPRHTSTAIFYPPPLYRARHMDSSTRIAVERIYVLHVPQTFLKRRTATPAFSLLSPTYSQFVSLFLTSRILTAVLRRVARKWPHGNKLWNCLYRSLLAAGRFAVEVGLSYLSWRWAD